MSWGVLRRTPQTPRPRVGSESRRSGLLLPGTGGRRLVSELGAPRPNPKTHGSRVGSESRRSGLLLPGAGGRRFAQRAEYQRAIVKAAGLPTMVWDGSRKGGFDERSHNQKNAPSIHGRSARARSVAS